MQVQTRAPLCLGRGDPLCGTLTRTVLYALPSPRDGRDAGTGASTGRVLAPVPAMVQVLSVIMA